MVRAKFKVDSIERHLMSRPSGKRDEQGREIYAPCEVQTIKMSPVYGHNDPNHENTKFWNASPGGQLSLNCVNADVVEQFKLGSEMYVDFTPAPVS